MDPSSSSLDRSATDDGGEIYCITNKIEGKHYIGQVKKFVRACRDKKGHLTRWQEHIYDAHRADNLRKESGLYDAIRKYGPEAFTVFKICDCTLEELDDKEQYYIRIYNSLSPKGYNMKEGGKGGKHIDEVKRKISSMQFGNRREKKNRKHDEDQLLPKYIIAKRENDVLVGYVITGFPIGINKCDYLRNISFYNKSNPAKALELAIVHLNNLKKQYANLLIEIEASRAAEHANDPCYKPTDIPKPEESIQFPDHLFPITEEEDGGHCGYFVDGMQDFKGNPIPRREFRGDNTMAKLVEAKRFIEQVEILNANSTIVEDWNMVDTTLRRSKLQATGFYLPRYLTVRKYKYKETEKITGFQIQGLPLKDINGNIYKYHKDFNDKSMMLDQKYRLAITHLKEMLELHRQQNTQHTNSSLEYV